MVWKYDDPRWLKVDKFFFALMLALFIANLLAWRGVPVFGSDPPFRPVASSCLSAGLLLQATASLVRRKSHAAFYVLLVASLVVLWFSLTIRR